MAGEPQRPGYRMVLVQLDHEGPPVRVKVVMFGRRRGMVLRWTDTCSGCTHGYEESGGTHQARGMGCFECGYTGRRRSAVWFPLPKAPARAGATAENR